MELVIPSALPQDHFGPLDDLMRTSGDATQSSAQLAASLDEHFHSGVFATVATEPAQSSFTSAAMEPCLR